MAFKKVADATVAIPLPGSAAKKYVKIGSVLETSNNDPSKGLPYMLMLDPFIDLGALHRIGQFSGDSIPVSFYATKERNRDWPPPDRTPPAPSPRPSTRFDDLDDDIPF